MPTYDYACQRCGHEFEEFQAITARSLRKCPECGKLALKRLIGTGAGIIFKGSGFYQTDYRSDSYKKAAEKESGAKTSKTADKKDSKSKSEAKGKTEPAGKKKSA